MSWTKSRKEALGKSQIIAGWDKEKIINAMNGYKMEVMVEDEKYYETQVENKQMQKEL